MAKEPTVPPVAHGYNDAKDDKNVEASFNDRASADAYADAYGGDVEGAGSAFVIRGGADHAKARQDVADAAEGKGPLAGGKPAADAPKATAADAPKA